MNEVHVRLAVEAAQKALTGNALSRRLAERNLKSFAWLVASEEFGHDAMVHDFSDSLPRAAVAAFISAASRHLPAPKTGTAEWYRWAAAVGEEAVQLLHGSVVGDLGPSS